jgi:rRNA maturation endonuclease Nob1
VSEGKIDLRLPPKGLKIHDPSPEDLDIVREAALRMGTSQFISDVTISLLLTEMADRYDALIDTGVPHSPTMHSAAAANITGWKYAVALSRHLTGRQ